MWVIPDALVTARGYGRLRVLRPNMAYGGDRKA